MVLEGEDCAAVSTADALNVFLAKIRVNTPKNDLPIRQWYESVRVGTVFEPVGAKGAAQKPRLRSRLASGPPLESRPDVCGDAMLQSACGSAGRGVILPRSAVTTQLIGELAG